MRCQRAAVEGSESDGIGWLGFAKKAITVFIIVRSHLAVKTGLLELVEVLAAPLSVSRCCEKFLSGAAALPPQSAP